MTVLGLATMENAAAALFRDGRLVAAAAEERFSRRKHHYGFPAQAIRWVLREAEVHACDLDSIGVSWKPWVLGRRLLRTLSGVLDPARFTSRVLRGGSLVDDYAALLRVRSLVARAADDGTRCRGRLAYVDHHLSHAASSFLLSPFEEAAILTADGTGEDTTAMLAVGRGGRITRLDRVCLPHSLGHAYASMTGFLGFRMNCDEGKVMGLAPYGDRSRYGDFYRRVLRPVNGSFRIDPHLLDYHLALRGTFPVPLLNELGAPRAAGEPLEQRHADIAAGLQEALESVLLAIARRLRRETGLRQLCLAGGVALNCSANGRLAAESGFDDLFLQPAASDDGSSLGAGLLAACDLGDPPRAMLMEHAAWGPAYSAEECYSALIERGVPFTEPASLPAACAALLARQRILGWFQGRMEFGPRALGQRSILADPRGAEMKDIVNARIKHREAFRPFGPSLPQEVAADWLEPGTPSPFMLVAHRVRSDRVARIPAVTHVDGSARPQTVSRALQPLYHELLTAFGRTTGVPVLLNTSFNVQGEPIVCTPQDAVACFVATGLDALAIGPYLAVRPV